MARPVFLDGGNSNYFQSITLVIGMFASISALVALCARRSTKAPTNYYHDRHQLDDEETIDETKVPKSPLRSPLIAPKKFLTAISNRAMVPFVRRSGADQAVEEDGFKVGRGTGGEGFGEGGLWQKNILMGEKCQPLEYSGVIYYDNYGKRVSELPRSPRVGSVPSPYLAPPIKEESH